MKYNVWFSEDIDGRWRIHGTREDIDAWMDAFMRLKHWQIVVLKVLAVLMAWRRL